MTTFASVMPDQATVLITGFFLISAYCGHQLLHRVIKTSAHYERIEKMET